MLTFEKYQKFINDVRNYNRPIILWAIISDEFLHPRATDISVVFIKNIDTKETFYVSFNHMDSTSIVTWAYFVQDLNSITSQKWVFDKKSFIQLLPVKDLLDIGLYSHIQKAKP